MSRPVLTLADYERAAARMGATVLDVMTVCEVEAPGGGFLPDGQVSILFERHQFSKRTRGAYDASHPRISNPKAGGYLGGAAEHTRLAEAVALNRQAALESTSWGKFQVMGFNHQAAGFHDLQQFINAMHESEGRQLDAFVGYVITNKLDAALRGHRWAEFARGYNGSGYAVNKYDLKLAAAYARLVKSGADK